jgi:hypothetical protein
MQIKRLTGVVADLEESIKDLQITIAILKESGIEKSRSITDLEVDVSNKQTECSTLRKDIEQLQRRNKEIDIARTEAESMYKSIIHGSYYKKLKRQEEQFAKFQKVLDDHGSGNCDIKISQLREQLKNTQTSLSNFHTSLNQCRSEKNQLTLDLQEWKQECAKLQDALTVINDKASLETREDGSNKFSEDIIKCVIELIGEAEVPADRCGQIIHIVSKHVHHVDIPLCDLPSKRSALRFSDRGHYLAKYHVAETLVNTKHWDLHSDGTSKDHRKFVGHQVTTADGNTLSCAFTPVDREDTETLLDIATNLLTELADVFDPSDADKQFKIMLTNLSGLMSDRASVMKSFDKEMNKARQRILETQEDLNFLHCNAHFLLGLSNSCEKVLKRLEKDGDEKLGRDNNPAFKRFANSGEGSASRYIRTACDVLGPRGDEKSGCRDAWEAFCVLNGNSSSVTSFRNNRFNNYFEGAAALHHHRNDIINFLQNYKQSKNLKLQSVLADAQSIPINSFLIALGIIYHQVTGPYWMLVRSNTHYLDFYKYVVKMQVMFQQCAKDSKSLLLPNPTPLFDDFQLPEDPVMQSLYSRTMTPEQMTSVQLILQEVFTDMLVVLERQLADFLPAGRYHNVQDDKIRAQLKHSKLTNLIGEACFGDLDFSIFKRRNASLHHHGTVNMLKRNHTKSAWFSQKSPEEQSHLLHESIVKAPEIRHSNKEKDAAVIQKHRQRLEESKVESEKKLQEAIDKKQRIVAGVKKNGGPCLSTGDVDILVIRFENNSARDRLEAIKLELQYNKLVMGRKSPKLNVTGKFQQLVINLKDFLSETASTDGAVHPEMADDYETVSMDQDDGAVIPEMADDSESASTDQGVEETIPAVGNKRPADDSVDEQPSKIQKLDCFKYRQQGTWVAVYYDDDFYVGQVLTISNEELAEVQFLQSCGVSRSAFRWPRRDDIDTVNANFVFASDFDVAVTTSNGRMWTVVLDSSVVDSLDELYKLYKKQYC